MKLDITPEQVKSLTDEQKEKLLELWTPMIGDQVWHEGFGWNVISFVFQDNDHTILVLAEGDRSANKCDVLPLLSIGQMIEMLAAKLKNFKVKFVGGKWPWEIWVNKKRIMYGKSEALCNMLWHLCKKELLEVEDFNAALENAPRTRPTLADLERQREQEREELLKQYRWNGAELVRGKYADVPTSSEEFIRRKEEGEHD